MGNCIYCGIKAGLFKSYHKECFNKYNNGKDQIQGLVSKTLLEDGDLDQMTISIKTIADDTHIRSNEIYDIMIRGYDMVFIYRMKWKIRRV